MKPAAKAVLTALHEAGPAGLQTGQLAKLFDEYSMQRRLVRVGTILRVFAANGNARRTGPEPSVFKHGNIVYRWHITNEGSQYLATGMRPGSAVRTLARSQEAAAERQRELDRRTELLATSQPVFLHMCQRDAEIRHLRAEGVLLQDIGDLWGITRERARQIAGGINVRPCDLPGHDYWAAECTHGLVVGPGKSPGGQVE